MTEEFALDLVEGELVIRDADPYALTQPTSVSGTVDTETGAISGGNFSTPPVSFRQDITSPIQASVFIDATFSGVTPGFGVVDAEGNVTFQVGLTVDLHIEVQPPGGGDTFLSSDCTATPVTLVLESVAPYADPDGDGPEPGRVTVADADFTVPPVPDDGGTGPCFDTIAGPVNEQLAGPGHSLEMTLEGDLVLPPPPGCPTSTTLVADPSGQARMGTPVTLTASVAVDEDHDLCIAAAEAGDSLAGAFVEFLDGTASLGVVPVDGSGTATLVSSAIPAGSRSLSATFRRFGAFEGSASAPVAYRVTPDPAITADLPAFVPVGAEPVEFDVTVSNTGFGADIARARLDATIRRSGADISTDRVVLEHRVGDAWAVVPLARQAAPGAFNSVVWGSVGDAAGFPLPVSGEVTRRMRIRFLATGGTVTATGCNVENETCPGPVDVAFELVSVDPSGTPGPVASPAPTALGGATGRIMVTEATRRPSTVVFRTAFGGGPTSPHTLRQGGTVEVGGFSISPNLAGARPTGYVRVELDDRPVPIRDAGAAVTVSLEDRDRITINPGLGSLNAGFDLPRDIPVGTHEVTVKYSGDARFLPSEASTTITVHPAPGAAVLYDCRFGGFGPSRFRAYVEGLGSVPAVVAAGSTVDLSGFTLRMSSSRDKISQAAKGELAPANGTKAVDDEDLYLEMGFGPGGTGTAASLTRSNGGFQPASPNPVPPANLATIDDTIVFNQPTASIDVDGAPGTTVPVTLDTFVVTGVSIVGQMPMTCTPVGEPVLFGEVTVAGTTLAVESAGVPREGTAVTLASTVAPYTTGQVEFRAGGTTIAVVPVVGGVARVAASLPAGTHTLTAIFTGGVLVPPLVSHAVELQVLPALQCREFAVEGHGATVRLVYLELLGRCPDRAGFDYWVGRLSGGLAPEAFARSIAATPEAVGRVVDDAYETMLGRPADPGGRAFWTGRLQASGRYDVLLADLGASEEFWSKAGGTNGGFVARVYERLLGRSPDEVGRDFWVGRLDGGASRRALILSLANLDEPLGVLVRGSYGEILDGIPDAGERSDGIAFLRSTGDRSGLYAQLIGRPEFADRAGTFPNAD